MQTDDNHLVTISKELLLLFRMPLWPGYTLGKNAAR